MVERVGQDQAVRNELCEGRNAGLVRDIAGREHQRCLLAVQIGQFLLELDQWMVGSGDIAGAASAGADAGRGLDHGADDLRVLTHAEVVVGAPDHDIARPRRGSARWRRGTGRRCVQDRRKRDSAARHEGDRARY